MSIRLKSKNPYWEKFSVYQTFGSVKDMNAHVKRFNQMYTLTPATKAVLNTLKLHSKTFFGVCWLYKEEIAKKAKVSLSSVTRAIKELKEIGMLTVHENMHTLRGGRTHNVYVINPTFEGLEDSPIDSANESAIEDEICWWSVKHLTKLPDRIRFEVPNRPVLIFLYCCLRDPEDLSKLFLCHTSFQTEPFYSIPNCSHLYLSSCESIVKRYCVYFQCNSTAKYRKSILGIFSVLIWLQKCCKFVS